jgi:hypothetical protein
MSDVAILFAYHAIKGGSFVQTTDIMNAVLRHNGSSVKTGVTSHFPSTALLFHFISTVG